jgi:succinoglycan biosynthesis transport protein ExoP
MAENESANDLGSYSALFRRRRVWILTILPGALLIAVFLAFALPAEYRSTATLMFEQAATSDTFLKSTVRSSDHPVDVIQGQVLTVAALEDLVREYDPYPDEKGLDNEAKALRIVQNTSLEHVDPVSFKPKDESSAVSLYYQNPDPRRASDVTTRLANLFLTFHLRQRVEAANVAEKIIADRAAALNKQLQEVDDEFARLRSANGGTLPDAKGGDEARYRAERDLNDLDRQLREAQERESLLTIQLSGTSPNLLVQQGLAGNGLPPIGAGAGPTGLTDIATVKAELADAELRYTPDHPDVKRLKRALEALEKKQSVASASPSTADNPQYRQVAGQLAAARADVTALQASTARARNQLALYTANANPTAALERQVADLERRRGSLQTQYQETQDQLKNAQLGEVAEAGKNAEHFTLLQSPYPASQPYSPNRLGLILFGFVLGGMLAAAAVAIAESTDATVRGSHDVAMHDGLPVLATIPEIVLSSDQTRRRLLWGSVVCVYLIVAALDGVAIGRAYVLEHRVEEAAVAPVASSVPTTGALSASQPQ